MLERRERKRNAQRMMSAPRRIDARTACMRLLAHNTARCPNNPNTPRVTQRAEEVQAVDPKVAYYCRLWAVDQVRVIVCCWRAK